MQVISVPPTDEFTLQLMTELVGNRPAYYVWSMHLHMLPSVLPEGQVILCVKDLVNDSLIQLVDSNPNKFIVCVSVENLVLANARIVRMGGDWLNQIAQYQAMQPVRDKNFTEQHVISLNRNPRHHRTTVASYLTGTLCPAVVTTMIKEQQTFLDAVPWDLSALTDEQRDALIVGHHSLSPSDSDIYKDIGLVNNIANFENSLRTMYRQSLVEIVSETTFAESAFNLTEKTMHCFAAFNFPLILSSCGTVQFLRDIGFDMFDDIIDHSYDKIEDSALRVVSAIDFNYEILHNSDLAKRKWQECQGRFEKNWEFICSGKLAQWYEARTRKEFSAALGG
jgi:hypothetical protein